jgi:hypothetical protein
MRLAGGTENTSGSGSCAGAEQRMCAVDSTAATGGVGSNERRAPQ